MVYLYYYYANIFMPDIENSGLTHIPTTLTFVAYRILLYAAAGTAGGGALCVGDPLPAG